MSFWIVVMAYTGCDAALYAFALFLPSIINKVSYYSLLPIEWF